MNFVTHACAIVALAVAVAVFRAAAVGAVVGIRNVVVGEAFVALTLALNTDTVVTAMVGTVVGQTIISLPSLVAHAHAFHTLAVGGGVEAAAMVGLASVSGTVNPLPPLIARALASNTHTVV